MHRFFRLVCLVVQQGIYLYTLQKLIQQGVPPAIAEQVASKAYKHKTTGGLS